MKIKNLLLTFLLFSLTTASVNAQTKNAPMVQNFESGMNGWTYLCVDDNENFSYGSISSEAHHGGEYSFHFVGAPYSYGYLISPVLEYDGGIDLSFFYTNYYVGAASFQVGYTTDEIDTDAFDHDALNWGEIIVANQGNMYDQCSDCSEEGWMEYANDFPVGVKHIVIAFAANELNLFVDDFSFTETSCPKPGDVKIEPSKTSLALNWSGGNDRYEIRYKNGFLTSFEYGFEGWTTINNDEDEYDWTLGEPFDYEGHNESEYCVYSESSHAEGTQEEELTPDNYLVSPLVPLGGSITFWAKGYDEFACEEHFGVAISTEGNQEAVDFETIIEWTAKSDWMKYTVDLSNYNGMGYVAIRHFRCDECDAMSALCVDDITIFTSAEWKVSDADENSTVLEDLMAETNYVIQLRGICEGSEYSTWTDEIFTMTSNADCRFINAGDWNDQANWRDEILPEEESDVVIAAAATIPAAHEAVVANITNQLGSITIADGGSLTVSGTMINDNSANFVIQNGGQYTGNSVQATVYKTVSGTSFDPDDNAGYTLIATPMTSTESGNSEQTNIATGDYDLYSYLPAPSDGLEWRNFKEAGEATSMFANQGYLYAHGSEDINVKFVGELNENYDFSLVYEENEFIKSLSLAGNSYTHNQTYYVYDMNGMPQTANFLTINAAGDGFTTSQGTSFQAEPLQGFFVQAGGDNWNLSTAAPTDGGQQTETESMINIMVSRNRGLVMDNAIVSFGNAPLLKKYVLKENAAKLYILENGREMAVVRAQSEGEIPVSFRASENGNYTISVEPTNVEMDHLHLVDNMTGADVDLLQTPSYTFDARTTDYASRFRLVFATTDAEEDSASAGSAAFAFNSNGSWIILNDGNATLQVVDVMGRLVSSETINGNAEISLNQPAGIYMLRLVNGSDVKVQKVVVR